MFSISAGLQIKKRAKKYWNTNKIWKTPELNRDLIRIKMYLRDEYELIPEEERIGKGSIFIAKHVAEGTIKLLTKLTSKHLEVIDAVFNYSDPNKDLHMKNYAIALLAEYASLSSRKLKKALEKATIWANNPDWAVREMDCYVFRKCLRLNYDVTFSNLEKLSKSDKENLRRTAIESLRTASKVTWMKDEIKSNQILTFLELLKADPSVYVRKSVGNNIKDLTKFMPEKILTLLEQWIQKANIQVTPDLVSKGKQELGDEAYFLVWTIKHALRWLRAKNTEFHPTIEKLLGQNYIKYYNEKKNKKGISKPVEKPIEEAIKTSIDESIEESMEKPSDESTEKPIDEQIDKTNN